MYSLTASVQDVENNLIMHRQLWEVPRFLNQGKPPCLILYLLGPKALDRSQIFKTWNEQLGKYVRVFANSHPNEITAMIYSSHGTFTRVLDAPESHGFALEDTDKKGGGIWRDDLHPTSAMHNIIAKDIARLLEDQPAFVHIGE